MRGDVWLFLTSIYLQLTWVHVLHCEYIFPVADQFKLHAQGVRKTNQWLSFWPDRYDAELPYICSSREINY
ncbi:hypothetical protein BDV34DRAFT_207927 [Aspergillus parasiticus]|uniref:Secreted protein n=1 Tax=Aspergillus parasiticus TaxID=5067 RepID=A0A5N6D4A2_ASPPA|nr:hypothetical protein BDV34DRAFT_207927 [Aspergillus parasiticus]